MNVRSLFPDSIAGRTAIVLLVGLVLSHIAAFAIYAGNRIDALLALGGIQSADRIATVARAFEGATPTERRRLVRTMTVPDLHVGWSEDPTVTREAADALARAIADRVRSRLGKDADLRIVVADGIAPFARDFPHAGHRMMGDMMSAPGWGPWHYGFMNVLSGAPGSVLVLASARLGDGSWVNVAMPIDPTASTWTPRFAMALGVMLAAALALSLWAARRTLRPLAVFASAANRLGTDVNAPPLAEGGAREVREAATAFNEMQRRLRRFIADRTQVLAAISHDLRTPITRMRLRLEFIDDAEQRSKMEADLQEMEAMIAATLSFARDEANAEPRVATDIAVLLKRVVEDAKAAGHDVRYAGPDHRDIVASPMLLRRAFANLIDNAIRYGERARVGLAAAPGAVRIAIEDDGPGIPESETEKVFAPFYRLEGSRSRETGGTGLGLTVARNAILGHGGTIELRNRAEGGLTVSVTLPG